MAEKDPAIVMNVIAEAVEKVLGDENGYLPLSVRYGAAEAAVRVVAAWREKGVTPEGGPYSRSGEKGAGD